MTQSECDVEVNAIVWIHALSEQDIGISLRAFEDVQDQVVANNYIFEQHPVSNKQDLKDLLKDLTNRAEKDGLRPILHFDAHGCEENGLRIAESGEFLAWNELHQEMRFLNAATNSNLVCILALCHGLKAFEGVSVTKPAPAFLFAAPEKEVTAGFLASEIPAFHKNLMETSDLMAAFNSTLGKGLRLVHSERLLFRVVLKYVKEECSNSKRLKRSDALLRELRKLTGTEQPSEQVKLLRSQAKEALKPGQDLVESLGKKFLVGRNLSFSFRDLEEAVNKLR